jgi:hypothetical protein
MDLVRPRAIPALIAALALPCAAADCASLQGKYQFQSQSSGSTPAIKLSDLSMSREGTKLYRVEDKGTGPGFLAGGQPMQRKKVTWLAETATLSHSPNDTRLKFMDAAGKPLAEMTINDTGRWSCKSNRLERTRERTAGLADMIRTEKVAETLERNAAGDLVLRESVTVAGVSGAQPKVNEAHFRAVPK